MGEKLEADYKQLFPGTLCKNNKQLQVRGSSLREGELDKRLYVFKMEEITAYAVRNNPVEFFKKIDVGKREKY